MTVDSQRLTGVMLILGGIVFAIGASLPTLGEKGNFWIFTLPVRDHLLAVAQNPTVWHWANVFMGAAAVVLLAALAMLSAILHTHDEHVLSRLGFSGVLLAALLWLLFSAFRAAVTPAAAQETIASGAVPSYYEPLARWAFALFYVYAVLASLALAAYGGSLLQVQLVPTWAGWLTLGYSAAMLVSLLLTGDTLPAFHYAPPLLIGLLLLLPG
jgi:hypothetical protein